MLALRLDKHATSHCVTTIFDSEVSYHRMLMPLMFSSLYMLIFMTKSVKGTENGAKLIRSPDNLETASHDLTQKAQLGTLTTASAQLLLLQSSKDFPCSFVHTYACVCTNLCVSLYGHPCEATRAIF